MDEQDHEPFLKTIYDNLDDDFYRLMYADWLEEFDTDRQRCEFIKIQIEIENFRKEKLDDRKPETIDEYVKLINREETIINQGGGLFDWFEEIPIIGMPTYRYKNRQLTIYHDKPSDSECKLRFKRGFLDEVEMPLIYLFGTSCSDCESEGIEHFSLDAVNFEHDICTVCKGFGGLNGEGTKILKNYPTVTKFVPMHQYPTHYPNFSSCYRKSDLPIVLYNKLKGAEYFDLHTHPLKLYASRDEGLLDLIQALTGHIKDEASTTK